MASARCGTVGAGRLTLFSIRALRKHSRRWGDTQSVHTPAAAHQNARWLRPTLSGGRVRKMRIGALAGTYLNPSTFSRFATVSPTAFCAFHKRKDSKVDCKLSSSGECAATDRIIHTFSLAKLRNERERQLKSVEAICRNALNRTWDGTCAHSGVPETRELLLTALAIVLRES